jgi:hypothetical protein
MRDGVIEMTNWSPTHKPAIGTKVIINPQLNHVKYAGIVWMVKKWRQKNVLLARANGAVGKDLIVNPEMLLPAPTPQPVADPLSSTSLTGTEMAAIVETVPYYPPISEGSVVRVAGPTWKHSTEKLYVILVDNTHKNNSVKLTELGGTQNGAYWPRVPRGFITKVDLADILKNA